MAGRIKGEMETERSRRMKACCEKARWLLLCGHPLQAVAGRTGLTWGVVALLVNQDADERAACRAIHRVPLTPERIRQIQAALRRGWKYRRIAAVLHCSLRTVCQVAERFRYHS